MIDRTEILAIATDFSLSHDVVEKDHVLGWLLAGIYAHERLAAAWIFKGGTCLRKCYFETYRFSEDLDFTLTDASHLEEAFLKAAFADVAAWVYDKSGIELPVDQMRFEVFSNPRGGRSGEGRIYYIGPLGRGGSLPRIKLDLTIDELLVLPPIERPTSHPYTDMPEGGIIARCYAYEEIFAEKIRALGERSRPRDLYDVINLFRHGEFRPAAAVTRDVLKQKCGFKQIEVPTLASLSGTTEELLADWQAMLGHQLPVLPPFEIFWSVLPEVFRWLESGAEPVPLAAAPLATDEEVVRPAVGALRREGILGSSFLEIVRFAAASRLCVDLAYQDSVRRIEPYSLRRTRAGDILLCAVRSDSGEARSYHLDRIQGVQVTNQTFAPRYTVELTPTAIGPIPPLTRPPSVSALGRTLGATRPAHRTPRPKGGPTYVFQCGVCGKKFEHSSNDSHLRVHKAPGGYTCSGRTGFFVTVKY
jgi:predicted nucleotidyltransferase component of viral defense system